MTYRIIWTENAKRNLRQVEHIIARRLYDRIEELSKDPFHNTIKLTGMQGYRARAGDYRIIFEVQHEKLIILIVKIGHRKNIY